MRFLLCLLFISVSLYPGCQNNMKDTSTVKTTPRLEKISKEEHLKRIEGFAAELQAKASQPLDYTLSGQLIAESKSYVKQNGNDKNNPALLFRAAEVARSIQHYEEAIGLFERVYTDYPDSPFAVKALFLEAATYEDGLKDKKKATKAYENLIKKHPNDPLAEQARQLLLVIDKTPEELVKEFQKKNKQ